MFKVSKMFIEDYEQIKDAFNEFDDFWSPENLKSELQAENREYVVVKDKEGLIVGFAGIILSVDDAEITNIVTKKDKRRQGIGSILINELIKISKEKGKDNISLEVNEENEYAIKLYEKNGFEVVGRRKNYYNNKNDAIIMTKYF